MDNSKFYTSTAWRKLRARKLANDPLCTHCQKKGIITLGSDIDHVLSIAKRPDLKLDYDNLQTLCKSCHSIKTSSENKRPTEVNKLNDWLKTLLK
ncbi:HNH endonuclease [Rufibacter sp. LB8]|uniref:HNH endonuclease n=1 Tax=Rufibacter sp. LB8 TaxID=2777781 RepID=UPI00178C3F5F